MNAEELGEFIDMLHDVCKSVHSGLSPTDTYANRAALLLFMIACHESDLMRARRQYSFRGKARGGAFSLFQMEEASIRDSLRNMQSSDALRTSIVHYLYANNDTMFPLELPTEELLDTVLLRIQQPEGDRWAAVLARLHILRIKAPVPDSAAAMASYAKKYWNTELGKATPLLYAACATTVLWWAITKR